MEHTVEKDGEEHDRQHVDSVVSMQDLVDSYMYPFRECNPGLCSKYCRSAYRPSPYRRGLLRLPARFLPRV